MQVLELDSAYVASKPSVAVYQLAGSPSGLQQWLRDLTAAIGATAARIVDHKHDSATPLALFPDSRPVAQWITAQSEDIELAVDALRGDDHELQDLADHLRRALHFQRTRKTQATTGEQVTGSLMDRCTFGIAVVIRDDGKIVYANETLSGCNAPLSIESGSLKISDPLQQRRLQRALKAGEACRINLTEGNPITLSLAPHPDPQLAICLVGQAEKITHLPTAEFGLTPKETRLVTGLLSGAPLAMLAEQYHVSLHTLRAQMKTVLKKTKQHSQASLVGLLLNRPDTLFAGTAH